MNIRYVLAITLCAVALMIGRASAGQSATIPATDTTPAVPAYVARPSDVPQAPGVLVLHGCEGYTKQYAAAADWLASKGYVAVAIDSLAPQGLRNACDQESQSRTQAADARAALAWMRAQPFIDPGHLALLGFSMGAVAALDVMDSRAISAPPVGLVAAVTYYPACRGRNGASVSVPLRILDGDADDWTPAPPCQRLADSATDAGKMVRITTYPGATHAFNANQPDRTVLGHHLSYNAAAATDAEAQTLTFLQQYLRAKP